jgi:hypothetical protein
MEVVENGFMSMFSIWGVICSKSMNGNVHVSFSSLDLFHNLIKNICMCACKFDDWKCAFFIFIFFFFFITYKKYIYMYACNFFGEKAHKNSLAQIVNHFEEKL